MVLPVVFNAENNKNKYIGIEDLMHSKKEFVYFKPPISSFFNAEAITLLCHMCSKSQNFKNSTSLAQLNLALMKSKFKKHINGYAR